MLLKNIFTAIGLSLLVLSAPLLDKIHAGSDYLTFNIITSFIEPHLQGVGAMSVLMLLLIVATQKYLANKRYLLVSLSAVLWLFIFRGFFSAAGISPQMLAGTIQQRLMSWGILPAEFSATNFRLMGAIGILSAAIYILARHRPTRRLAYFAAAFGFALGAVTLGRVVPIIEADSEFASVRTAQLQPGKKPVPQRRVVWAIFDEFDYDIFFAHRNPALSLPNLDRLQRVSISADNATSPADATLISIPALVMGSPLAETKGESQGKLRIKLKDRRATEALWNDTDTVFARLKAKNQAASILGFYHPYCNVFPYAQPCESFPMFHYPGWWWGFLQAARIIPGVDYLVKKNHLNGGGFGDVFRQHLKELPSHLASSDVALSFFHFNVPHPPGGRISNNSGALVGYEKNGLAVDLVVGMILNELEAQAKSQDILLIVSTDHWLRLAGRVGDEPSDVYTAEFGKPRPDIRKIPLIIHRIGEKSAYTIAQPINTVHTSNLILDFLDGKVSDQASIVEWWRAKPYFEPVISGRRSAF